MVEDFLISSARLHRYTQREDGSSPLPSVLTKLVTRRLQRMDERSGRLTVTSNGCSENNGYDCFGVNPTECPSRKPDRHGAAVRTSRGEDSATELTAR